MGAPSCRYTTKSRSCTTGKRKVLSQRAHKNFEVGSCGRRIGIIVSAGAYFLLLLATINARVAEGRRMHIMTDSGMHSLGLGGLTCNTNQNGPQPPGETPDVLVDLASVFHLLSRNKHNGKSFPLGDILNPVAKQAVTRSTWEAKCSERDDWLTTQGMGRPLEDVQKKIARWYREDALLKVLHIGLFSGGSSSAAPESWLVPTTAAPTTSGPGGTTNSAGPGAGHDADRTPRRRRDSDPRPTLRVENSPRATHVRSLSLDGALMSQQPGRPPLPHASEFLHSARPGHVLTSLDPQQMKQHQLLHASTDGRSTSPTLMAGASPPPLPPTNANRSPRSKGASAGSEHKQCLLVGDDRALYTSSYYQALRRGAWEAFHEDTLGRLAKPAPGVLAPKKVAGRRRKILKKVLAFPFRAIAYPFHKTAQMLTGEEREKYRNSHDHEKYHQQADASELLAATPEIIDRDSPYAAGHDGRVLLKWCDPEMHFQLGIDDYKVPLRTRILGHAFSRLVDHLSSDVRLKFKIPLGEADCFFKNQRNVVFNSYAASADYDEFFSMELFAGLQCNLVGGLPPAVVDLFWKLKVVGPKKEQIKPAGAAGISKFADHGADEDIDIDERITRQQERRDLARGLPPAMNRPSTTTTRGSATSGCCTAGLTASKAKRRHHSADHRGRALHHGAATSGHSTTRGPQHLPDVAVSSEFDVGLRGSLAVVNAVSSIRRQILGAYKENVKNGLHSIILQQIPQTKELRWGAKLRDWLPTKQTALNELETVYERKQKAVENVLAEAERARTLKLKELKTAGGAATTAAALLKMSAPGRGGTSSEGDDEGEHFDDDLTSAYQADRRHVADNDANLQQVEQVEEEHLVAWNLRDWPLQSNECTLGVDCREKLPPMKLQVLEVDTATSGKKEKTNRKMTIEIGFPQFVAGFLEVTNLLLKELDLACYWTHAHEMVLAFGNGYGDKASGARPGVAGGRNYGHGVTGAGQNMMSTAAAGVKNRDHLLQAEDDEQTLFGSTRLARGVRRARTALLEADPLNTTSVTSADSAEFEDAIDPDVQQSIGSRKIDTQYVPHLAFKLQARCDDLTLFKHFAGVSVEASWEFVLAGNALDYQQKEDGSGESRTSIKDRKIHLLDWFEITKLSAEMMGTHQFPLDGWVVKQLRGLLREQVLGPTAWELQQLASKIHIV
ncbi:unnamed protein product [Amoebophrya sp. A120]|nr:unnamed protein product [Amoebophrya sp. A120]|eukprot:GSA120T00002088001.1